MSRWDRYVMVPYRDFGRGFGGADCFGLYMLILAEEAGIKLEEPGVSYGTDPGAARRKIEGELMTGGWRLVAQGDGSVAKRTARVFDGIHMSAHVRNGRAVASVDLHIGCAIGDGRMIHTERGHGTSCVRLDDPSICGRVKAVYRPEVLA